MKFADKVLALAKKMKEVTGDSCCLCLESWAFNNDVEELRWAVWDGHKHHYIESGSLNDLKDYMEKRIKYEKLQRADFN